MSTATTAGAAASMVAVALLAGLAWRASQNVVEVGFWFDLDPGALPPHVTEPLGGALTAPELTAIEQLSRAEFQRAFRGLRLSFSDRREAFWKVEVLNDLVVNTESPYAGRPSGVAESFLLGPLGGRATISFSSLAQFAASLAPDDAGRAELLEGLARGIARAGIHELAHLIVSGDIHDRSDSRSYEYPFADRAEQYYGDLHWGRAWPFLVDKVGHAVGVSRPE